MEIQNTALPHTKFLLKNPTTFFRFINFESTFFSIRTNLLKSDKIKIALIS